MATEALTLTDEAISKLAATAIVSEDTIKRRMLGLPVKGKAGERADAVLAQYCHAYPVDTEVRRATVDELEKSRRRVDELERGIRSVLHGNDDDSMEEPAARLDASLDMLRALLPDGGGA